jgi:type VII secretion protein EssA
MKRKQAKQILLILLMMAVFYLTNTALVYADTTKINELVPNDYQQNEFKSNTNLLKDNTLRNQPANIPEELKGLTFEKEKVSKDEQLKNQLFLSSATDQNTVKAKAEELELFSSEETTMSNRLEEDTPSSSNLSLSILIWGLVGVSIVLLIFVLVVWGRTQAKQKSPQNA